MSVVLDFTVIPSGKQLPRFDWNQAVFQGIVRVPGNTISGTSFSYNQGGIALTDYGTLFAISNNTDSVKGGQKVIELNLPIPKNVTILNQAPTATVRQPFTEPSEGRFQLAAVSGTPTKIGGLLVYNNKLYVSYYAYYDANSSQILSQVSRPINLSTTGQVNGPFKLIPTKPVTNGTGKALNSTRFINGYMFPINNLVIRSLTGSPCLMGSIAENISGGSSNGPDFFGWDPDTLSISSPVTPISYYPVDRPLGVWNQQSSLWNGTSRTNGVIHIEGTCTLLVAATMGIGPFTYGAGGQTPNGDNWAFDPIYIQKGDHAYPYINYLLAYDIYDAMKSLNPWDVRPYATWQLNLPFTSTVKLQAGGTALNPKVGMSGGIAYDSINKRIVMMQGAADGTLPLLYFFGV